MTNRAIELHAGLNPPPVLIIIPVLNEASRLPVLLDQLTPLLDDDCRLVLVDGGSHDGSVQLARSRAAHLASPAAVTVLTAECGRALQMQAGLRLAAPGDSLWFLHADVQISEDTLPAIRRALVAGSLWGRFDVRLSGDHPLLRMVEFFINYRSALTGICTGDQGIFVRMDTLQTVGGLPIQPLMEDVELSTRLKKIARGARLRNKLIVSSRKWEQNGIIRTILLMWALRMAYFLGIPARFLVRFYYSKTQK